MRRKASKRGLSESSMANVRSGAAVHLTVRRGKPGEARHVRREEERPLPFVPIHPLFDVVPVESDTIVTTGEIQHRAHLSRDISHRSRGLRVAGKPQVGDAPRALIARARTSPTCRAQERRQPQDPYRGYERTPCLAVPGVPEKRFSVTHGALSCTDRRCRCGRGAW